MKALKWHTEKRKLSELIPVLDLFAGSGSTLIAAEQTNRNAYLCEIDEAYCQVILDRFTNFAPTSTIKKL